LKTRKMLRPPTTRILATAAIAALVAGAFSVSAGASGKATHAGAAKYYGKLKTPSGNVYCDYSYGKGFARSDRFVVCGFKGKLVPPEPPQPASGCPYYTSYLGNRMMLRQWGPGQEDPCVGDPGPFLNPKQAVVLPYGQTWRHGSFACTSLRTGMKCKNAGGHGFYLAKHNWRVF